MFKKVLIASAMLVSVISANANTASFGVAGTITPDPCNITLTGGGLADYGTVNNITVKGYVVANNTYTLGAKLVPFSVTCTGPTKVAFAFTDSRLGKNFPYDGNDPVRYGIVDGSAGTTAIGTYEFFFQNTLLDGVAAAGALTTTNGSTTWSTTNANSLGAQYTGPGRSNGFIKTVGNTSPDAFTTASGSLSILARVSKPYVDASTSAIVLNGGGTITLVYL